MEKWYETMFRQAEKLIKKGIFYLKQGKSGNTSIAKAPGECYACNKNNGCKGGMAVYPANDIAKYIIRKSIASERPVTNLQLQKILYYVQGYFLKWFNTPAFGELVYNWPYGPAVPDVYFNYNRLGGKTIDEDPAEGDDEGIAKICVAVRHKKCIDKVTEACAAINISALIERVHEEAPWKESKRSEVIDLKAISEYFAENDPLGLRE